MNRDKAKAVVTMVILATAVATSPALVHAGDAEQDKTIAAIEAVGGKVRRGEPVVRRSDPAFIVDLGYTQVTDAGLERLAGLKGLYTLDLGGTQITDAGLVHLAGLKGLRSLDLGATKVTDAGIARLTGLKELQTLVLRFTKVTDAGLVAVAKLNNLRNLDLVPLPANKDWNPLNG